MTVAPAEPKIGTRAYRSVLARYYRHLVPKEARVLEIGCATGALLAELPNPDVTGIDVDPALVETARRNVPRGRFFAGAGECFTLDEQFDVIIISDTLNFATDAQAMLSRVRAMSHPGTRLVVNFHSTLWRPVRWLAEHLGLVAPQPPCSWLSAADVANLLELSGWQLVSTTPRILLPLQIPLVSTLVNRWLAAVLPWFCMTVFQVARPFRREAPVACPSVSIMIPARNEAGNIRDVIRRTPQMGQWTEFIFVEGHSRDETWREIQSLAAAHPTHRIKVLQQTGIGKGNAVREGLDVAEGDILMILDADLTMPPEELPKYYHAIASGLADFANGSRLVYPMHGKAMRFFNLCANKFFAVAFSWVLGQPVKDTLCGTKALRRADYLRIAAGRSVFGDFDPFGDFDLLFGAGRLHLKIMDIPVRYRERQYGTTNIQRWRHGALLFRMLWFGVRKLKCV